jgi:rubrerythrin
MGLFERAGRKFEETKRALVDGTDAAYVCRSCEESVATNSEYCPHCGEGPVDPVE